MEGDGRSPDDEEDEDAGAELRVVKRCLRKALNMSTDEKDLFVSRVEELVVAVSRLMHHGSLLATNYVLHRMNDGNPPSDDLLTDQTFYRQCMTYSSSSVRSGAYPEVKSFADTKRHLIPHTEQVPYSGNCVNAAARKLKSSVLTILSHRFHQRVTSAVRAMFPDIPDRARIAIKQRCLGRPGGPPIALTREAWAFVDAVRGDIFHGADVYSTAVEEAVWNCRGIKKADREAVCTELLAGRMPEMDSLKGSGREVVTHVLEFLPACRAHRGAVPDEEVRRLVAAAAGRVFRRATDEQKQQVVEDVIHTTSSADRRFGRLISAARSMLRFAGVISIGWLKTHPARALIAVRRMMLEVEDGIRLAEKLGKKRRPKRFPLLPIFGQRRQMVTLDADTLVGLCKAVGILPSGAGRKALTEDFKRSLLRVPAGFVFSDKTSLQSDGVAIVLRTSKTNPLASAEMATKDDLEDIVFDRVLANDPGRADIATVVEWTDEEGLKRGSTRLTRKEYYQQAGINRRARKRRMRDRAISEHLNKWKEASIKTADPEAFEEALRVRMSPLPGSEGDPSIEVVWGHQLARWTSIMDMTAFAAKRRTLDRFWRHKVGLEARHDLSRTVVVFGDGKFSASGRGERAVPRKAMEASAARFAAKVVKRTLSPSTTPDPASAVTPLIPAAEKTLKTDAPQ
eukprot:jgi/Tetstr1/447161/TSEL_034598.t1